MKYLSVLSMTLWLAACALPQKVPAPVAPPSADRAAILAMAGTFAVTFDFRETVALAPDYALKPPKVAEATEWVTVVEDTPTRIVLQHVLVMGASHHVVKHWRQDWTWQPQQTWRYEGERRWTRHAVPAGESAGRWEQSVWQVDDSPRYFGIGRWTHAQGLSSWTSDVTARPLPRREHSTRDDYDILMAVNRHVITPDGWVHEQDNTKRVLREGRDEVLAREVGVNTYRRLAADDYDFTAGREYWARTAPFWGAVRHWWAQRMAAAPQIDLRATVDGQRMYRRMFDLAELPTDEAAAQVATQLEAFDRTPGGAS